MSPTLEHWSEVKKGSIWRNRKTGRTCEVLTNASGQYATVSLKHETGRITEKQVHYFLYDFEKVMSSKPIATLRTAGPIFSMDDLIDSLDQEAAESLIIQLDRAQQDYEFTERLAKHFLSELNKAAEELGEPLDLGDLLPTSKQQRPAK